MGNRFKEVREKTGYSLDYVEKQSGVSKNTIWKLEHDMVDAGYKLIVRLADFYNVNVSWLIGQSDSPSLDESCQAVTNVTGLSDKAIQNLKIMKAECLSGSLNDILESEDFFHALERFEAARMIHAYDTELPEDARNTDQAYFSGIKDSSGAVSDYTLLSKSTQTDMLIGSATQILGSMLRDILKGGTK